MRIKFRGRPYPRDLKRCFSVLERKDRIYLIYIVGIQVGIGIFDLASIALMGVVGSLAISGVQSRSPSSQVKGILDFLNIENSNFQSQIAVLALITALFLVSKTIISLYFTRRVVFYLSAKGARLSSKLIQQVAELPLSDIKRFSEQSLLFSISGGVNVVLVGVIASTCNLITDLSLLIMLSAALFIINPIIAILSILLFGITAIILYLSTRKRAFKWGEVNSTVNIASNRAILNLFNLYRELSVRNRKPNYVAEISKMRIEMGRAIAEINFLPSLSKYIMEITLVLGGFLIVAVQLMVQDAVNAAGALAVFLTAATRITPALLRVQQSATGIKSSLGMAAPTLKILEELPKLIESSAEKREIGPDLKVSPKKKDGICFKKVYFSYTESKAFELSNISFSIEDNQMVALVGPSGSGKSTLVDLLLGILEPSKGSIEIHGLPSARAISSDEIKIGYVPQDVTLLEGTLRENLIFGFDPDEFEDEDLWATIEMAELKDDFLVAGLSLDSRLGPGGQSLSGGQKQRLGIARALLLGPSILVLDEATSALDSETEEKLNRTIRTMKGSTTLILIAHRLSSVMNADKVMYMSDGKLIATGTFLEVRSRVSDFDNQAKLMGL
jgi:ABC-type multidrug transport system fused ATPase/permease subunit